jgi:hypothetical protein
MRCHICDRLLDEPKFDPDMGEIDPCPTCMAVIEDAIGTYTEKPAAAETDLGIDPLWDELFPPTYDPLGDIE